MFGREFPFDDLLALWDVLLAEDPELDLVDMVSVAMLLRIRWQCESSFKRNICYANVLSNRRQLFSRLDATSEIPGAFFPRWAQDFRGRCYLPAR